ncbi:hypothetical protein [Legionella fallonii]|uniref:Uncharacterized protein n=1 Tax=Legionella fallonii LLAP-10 TaxID=1212491 RepID=A0A098G6Y3_9GAMM|nr:hypothetical protein [Legionella fallonii]CEG58217.1 protein of unknown function [Legionella fallonii LLAP-10]
MFIKNITRSQLDNSTNGGQLKTASNAACSRFFIPNAAFNKAQYDLKDMGVVRNFPAEYSPALFTQTKSKERLQASIKLAQLNVNDNTPSSEYSM